MHKSSAKTRTQDAERFILYGIMTIVAFAPLPLGSNRPLPIAIITTLIGALSIYWSIFATKDKCFVRISMQRLKWLALSVLIVFLWAIIQILPLDIANLSSDFWTPAKQLLPNKGITASVSITPHESWLSFFKMLSYVIIFWLTLQISKSSRNAGKILRAISWSGTGYAVYGLMIQVLDIKKILWFDKVDYLGSLTSTFINRNNYATYAGITLIVSVGLFLNNLFDNAGNLRNREFYKVIIQRIFTSSLPSLLIVFIISAALALTGSRAGISCSALGVLAFMLLSSFTSQMKKRRKTFSALGLLIAVIFLLIFSAGGNLVMERFQNLGGDASYREFIYNITLDAINDSPLKGAGLGSFTDVFNAYLDNSVIGRTEALTNHAHNSYLELMLELGTPIAMLLFSVIAAIWIKCLAGVWRRRKGGYIPAIAASSTILVATHALFDFSAQIPAVAIVFTVLLAVGCAQSWSTQVDISDASEDITTAPIYYKLSIKLTVIIGGALLLAGLWQLYSLSAETPNAAQLKEIAYSEIQQGRDEGVLTQKGIELLKSAELNLEHSIRLAPVDAYSWTYLAYAKLLSSDDRKEVARLLSVSISNGYYRRNLIFFRLRIIPIIWAYADEDEKTLFANQIKLAWQISPNKTARIMSSPLAKRLLDEQLQKSSDYIN